MMSLLVCLPRELKVKNEFWPLYDSALTSRLHLRYRREDILSVANQLSFKGGYSRFRAGTQKDTKMLESVQVFCFISPYWHRSGFERKHREPSDANKASTRCPSCQIYLPLISIYLGSEVSADSTTVQHGNEAEIVPIIFKTDVQTVSWIALKQTDTWKHPTKKQMKKYLYCVTTTGFG